MKKNIKSYQVKNIFIKTISLFLLIISAFFIKGYLKNNIEYKASAQSIGSGLMCVEVTVAYGEPFEGTFSSYAACQNWVEYNVPDDCYQAGGYCRFGIDCDPGDGESSEDCGDGGQCCMPGTATATPTPGTIVCDIDTQSCPSGYTPIVNQWQGTCYCASPTPTWPPGSRDCGDWGDVGDYACSTSTTCVKCVAVGDANVISSVHSEYSNCPAPCGPGTGTGATATPTPTTSTPGTGGPDYCDADPAGTRYNSPCSPELAKNCGSDLRETVCKNGKWESTGNCCTTPGIESPATDGTFCEQAGYNNGSTSSLAAVPCPDGIPCHDSSYNYCCFDHDPTGYWTPGTGDTCHAGNTNEVSCDDANSRISISSGTYTVVKFISHNNVSCPYNGPVVSTSTYTGPATIGFGSDECGQIDVNGACGVCKATGCGTTTLNSPTPTPTITSTPTATPTPQPGECGSNCNSISCDSSQGLVCVTSDVASEAGNAYCSLPNVSGGYQFETVCAANATSSNAGDYCCTTPTPTLTLTPTATATPIPGECGADCSILSCDSSAGLTCVETGDGSYCAETPYIDACAAITSSSTQDVGAICCSAPTETPTTTPTITNTPTATPTPQPGECGHSCTDNDDCNGDLVCTDGQDGKYCAMSQYIPACNANATASNAGDYCCTAPTATPTPVQITVVTTKNCNDTCSTNVDCSNASHICYNNRCRLAQNPTDEFCRMPDGSTQVVVYVQATAAPQQPVPPAEPIVAGPNWGRIIQIGLAALAIGALLLLFL